MAQLNEGRPTGSNNPPLKLCCLVSALGRYKGNVVVLRFSAISFFAPTYFMPDIWGSVLSLGWKTPTGCSPTDLHLAQLVRPAGTWTQLHWQPVLTDYFLPLHPLEERQWGQSVLSQSRFFDWKDNKPSSFECLWLSQCCSGLFCSPEVHISSVRELAANAPPTDSYRSLCQLSCARPYPCSSNHYPSSPPQEMSSATMKSLTVLSVFVCAGVYQSMSKVNLGCPFRHIHLYNILHPGLSLAWGFAK